MGKLDRCKYYDNGGATFDRYTVIMDGSAYTMSHNALSPQGVNMYCCQAGEMVMTGREVKFADLPTEVQRAVRMRGDSVCPRAT